MKNILLTILSTVLVFSSGCSTTQVSRSSAAEASRLVAKHRTEQEKRLQEINDRYQKTFSQVMKELTSLYRQQTQQQMDVSALKISDNMVDDWESETLPGHFRQTFLDLVRADYERLRSAESTLDQARQQYADDFKEVSLKLKLLKDIEDNLAKLSEKPKQAKDAMALLQAIYGGYELSQKKDNK